jgi:drug/metabolite transporter (DMT)-like permease
VAEAARGRANFLLVLASAIWGFAFVTQRIGADYVGAFTFNAVRFALGGLVLVAVIAFLDRRRGLSRELRWAATKAVVWPGAVCGALLAAAAGLQQAAMTTSTAGNAAFVTAMYIVLVPVFGVFLGRRVTWFVVAGIVLCVAGLYLICVRGDLALGPGDLLLLGAAVMFAVQILFVERFSAKLSALRFSTAQFFGCAAVSAVAALFFDAAPFGGMERAVVPLLYTGVLSVGVAYTLQVVGQRDALAAHAALIMSLESVFGALSGALFLGEDMGARGYTGALLMVVGIVVSQGDLLGESWLRRKGAASSSR